MKLRGLKLELVKDALQYGVLYSQNEAETAEFALLLIDVQGLINKEAANGQHIYHDYLLKEMKALKIGESFNKVEFLIKYRGDTDYYTEMSFNNIFTRQKKLLPEREYKCIKGMITRLK